MCFTLYGVPVALGQALVAYGVRDPARLGHHHRRILLSSLGLLVPVVVVLVVFAPVILAPFGPWYASQGVLTVRLLALSALPNAVVALTVSRARVDRRMPTVVTTLGVLCLFVLGLTWLLVPHVGIVGGAVAWLCGQLAVAGGIGIRSLTRDSPTTSSEPGSHRRSCDVET
jgi:O-antigen/teichoic acid export membrane protein